MKRTLCLAALITITAVGAAFAAQRIRLVVPVEISGVPAAIENARVECAVSSSETFDPRTEIGHGDTQLAVEGGRYSGLVAVDVLLGAGMPLGVTVDSTLEGRSYSCSITLRYRCTTEYSRAGWCERTVGGSYGSTPPAIAALFETDPARAPISPIQGNIDRAHATTLPRS